MNRRDALKIGVAAATTTVASPQEHLHAALFAPQTVAKQASWKPMVFTPAQNNLVVALTDLIIPATDTPGAKAALVNRYIDLFLANGSTDERERFVRGLKWLDDYTAKEFSKSFVALTPDQQVAVLTKLDEGERDPALSEGHHFFRMAKGATVRFYYQTEIGFKELNKNGVGALGCNHKQAHSATGETAA